MKYKENKSIEEPQEEQLTEVEPKEEEKEKSASKKLEDTLKKIIECRLSIIEDSIAEIKKALCKLDIMSSDESDD